MMANAPPRIPLAPWRALHAFLTWADQEIKLCQTLDEMGLILYPHYPA